MRATETEFRNRFWIIGGLFGLAFACYQLDPENAGVALARCISGEPTGGQVRLVFACASALVAVAALLRTWASAYLASEIVHDTALRTDNVVADGPYRHVRNPLYLALILMSIGMGAMVSRSGFPLLVGGIAVLTLRLIFREETGLEAAQGDGYRRFRDAVPRLLPSLRARLPAGDARPAWGQALAGEAFFWGFAAAMVAFTITMDLRVYGAVVAASFITYWIAVFAGRRR